MFEPVHGSAPKHAGSGRANPVAAILSIALLLEHLGYDQAAADVEEAVRQAIIQDETTPDLGGARSTSGVGDWIASQVGRQVVRER